MIKMIKNLWFKLRCKYVVIAVFDGKIKEHLAIDIDDAFEWIECYGKDDYCVILEKKDRRFVAGYLGA